MHAVRGVGRLVADLDRAAGFYCAALGFVAGERGPAELVALGLGTGERQVLHLGRERLALVRIGGPAPSPGAGRSNDLGFQHLAIVVRDIDAAYVRLRTQPGWQPISTDGPQLLPPANGAVRAFKFRDPDGHPLELIWFPPGVGRPVWQRAPGLFLGIDHSALAIASVPRSLAFYRRLGLAVTARSLNHGPAQARLDGLPGARVRVTGLRVPGSAGMGLELLGYRPPGRTAGAVVTQWTELGGGAPVLRDPDGHWLVAGK